VTSFTDLSESVAYYATLAAEKLRRDKSVACSICVIIHTNSHQEYEPQYHKSLIVPLPQPSDSTITLVAAALNGLKTVYSSGFRYKKSGVLLMGLHPKSTIQRTLFDDPIEQDMSTSLMQVMDAINQKMGAGKLSVAASGICKPWAMRREGKSPNYTTDWKELPEVA
jgi:DNA polymerase V